MSWRSRPGSSPKSCGDGSTGACYVQFITLSTRNTQSFLCISDPSASNLVRTWHDTQRGCAKTCQVCLLEKCTGTLSVCPAQLQGALDSCNSCQGFCWAGPDSGSAICSAIYPGILEMCSVLKSDQDRPGCVTVVLTAPLGPHS
jgi:hypothetical protein